MKQLLILTAGLALMFVIPGCATSPAKRTEALLAQSGFKPVKVATAAQQQRMNALPAARLSRVQRKGQTYYVYPDPARNLLYVGNKAQYDAYQIAAQDEYLAQDAKLVNDASVRPVLSEDAAEMSGAGPTWEEIWEGWPE